MLIKFIILLLVCFVNADESNDDGELPPKVHDVLQLTVPVELTEPPPTYIANLTLECVVTGNPTPTISWQFNGKDIQVSSGEKIKYVIQGNRLTVRDVKGRDGVNPNDSGAYRCIATNKFGSVFLEKEINIRVLGAFSAQNHENKAATKLRPIVYRNFEVKCPTHSRPDGYGMTYQWGYIFPARNGEPATVTYWRPGNPNPRVYIDYNTGILRYSYVIRDDIKESRDIGGLRCFLVNHNQIVPSNRQVLWDMYNEVTARPEKPLIKVQMPSAMVVPVESSYSMVCGADGYPNPSFNWTYNGIEIKPNKSAAFEFFKFSGSQKQELIITKVMENSGGTFKCLAYNAEGKEYKEGKLTVNIPPKWKERYDWPDLIDAPINRSMTLNCKATGKPEPTYAMYYNGKPIVNDADRIDKTDAQGGMIRINNAQVDKHDGMYTCVAKNSLDTLTQSVYIRVGAAKKEISTEPTEPTKPTVDKSKGGAEKTEGELCYQGNVTVNGEPCDIKLNKAICDPGFLCGNLTKDGKVQMRCFVESACSGNAKTECCKGTLCNGQTIPECKTSNKGNSASTSTKSIAFSVFWLLFLCIFIIFIF